MKILIPVIGFAPSGGYRVLARLATEWIRAGAEVNFLAPSGSGASCFPTEAAIFESDLVGRIVPGGGAMRPPGRLEGARRLACLFAGLRRLGPAQDIVLANHSLTAWPVALAGRPRLQRCYYIQAYEPDYFRMERHWAKWLLSVGSYRLPLRQISNSPTYAAQGAIRAVAVLPPGLDFETYHPKDRPRDFADGRPIHLGCIGRREPAKGLVYVLRAFEALHAADPRFCLRVAYGNLPPGYVHAALEVVAPRDDAELADFYRGVDILLAPGTVQHGAPHYPVMEAMACATPVVTTGYMPADPTNSWIVANRSAPAIAEAVRQLVADAGYHQRVAAALDAIAPFAWEVLAGRMLSLFSAGGDRRA